MPTRSTYLGATFNGVALSNILSASCRYGWKQNVPEATIFVPTDPFPGRQPYDQSVTLTMGAGSNNIVRFRGLFRKYNYSLWPRALGLYFRGYLTRALEYENNTWVMPDYGGLDLATLTNTPTPTDTSVVQAVLSKAGVSFNARDVQGTGRVWASRSNANYLAYVWKAGGAGNVQTGFGGVGEGALAYIQKWDRVSAVYSGTLTDPVGFYRTYETVNGIYRSLIGGRPRSTAQLRFNEGVDIEPGAISSREYPVANAVYVTGADFGIAGANPVRNYNGATFVGQASNPFQPSSRSVTYQFSSPFIEWGLGSDGGIGMNCEMVGNALLADLNRETVTVRVRTPRDDYIAPGMVITLGGPGNQPDRLGMGEPLWVDEVTTGVAEDGSFYQDITATGGGTPDGTPPPQW